MVWGGVRVPKVAPGLHAAKTGGGGAGVSARAAMASQVGGSGLAYPVHPRSDTVDVYHGSHEVADPWRALEDPDAPSTAAFVSQQNETCQAVLAQCDVRDRFRARMEALYDYPKFGCPFRRGKAVYYFHNSGMQAQSVLYQAKEGTLGEDHSGSRIVLDPNALSEDGTVALSSTAFSKCGTYMAYMVSEAGSDWNTIRVMRASDGGAVEGEDLKQGLQWVKFSCLAWTHDHRGFFYNRYASPGDAKEQDAKAGTETDINVHQKLYYHVLGTKQEDDVLVWEDPENAQWMFGAEVTDDGRYLLLSTGEGCDPVNKMWYLDLEAAGGGTEGSDRSFADVVRASERLPFVRLVDTFDAQYDYIGNDGTHFTFKTNLNAPKYKLVRVAIDDREMHGKPDAWTDLVAEREHVLEWAAVVNHTLAMTCYLCDVTHKLRLHDFGTGKVLSEVPTGIGSIAGFSGRREDPDLFFKFTSFVSPGTIFHVPLADLKDPSTVEAVVHRETDLVGFEKPPSELFETKQEWVTSKDGTRVPCFIVHKRGLELDGTNPCLLYGYGGFNISITPSYSVSRTVFLAHLGGVLCVANLRGGGEYGEEWHKAGTHKNKQNVFDDFQATAEHLARRGYTSPKNLAIEGGSNGGLLVGACANQRPDLFGAAIAHVGVMDMLRFHRFTIGHAWTTDFGCADKDEENFAWLKAYSPVHNVPKSLSGGGQYPATMVLTGDHDDRVVPLHSLKFIAELQHVLGGLEAQTNPLIARIDVRSGHGAGKPTKKVIQEHSDVYGFIAKYCGATWTD